MFDKILKMIQEGLFDCVEDAIDYIVNAYKSGEITLEERNQLINKA